MRTLLHTLLDSELVDDHLKGAHYCINCSSPRLTSICRKCSIHTITPDSGWINPRMPDLQQIMFTGKSCGYTIAIHGSLEHDLDLVAIPWSTRHLSKELLLESLCGVLNARIVDSGEKPLGRTAYNLQIDGYFKLIDLSVITLA